MKTISKPKSNRYHSILLLSGALLIMAVLLAVCMFSEQRLVTDSTEQQAMEPAATALAVTATTNKKLATLPKILNESSGIELAGHGLFWSLNDGKGEVALYQFDTLGNLRHRLEIEGATNVDWEDLAQDKSGNLYIGDFGNNGNDRKDLVIYKVTLPATSPLPPSVPAEKIEFEFPDQRQFPPDKPERFFDIESMFSKGQWLYLLTRDRSKPFAGKTRLYRVPNEAGKHKLTYMAEFNMDKNKENGQATAADLSPDDSTMVLLTSGLLWIFQDIEEERFFEGKLLKVTLPMVWDWEGVVFEDPCRLLLVNEEKSDEEAILFQVDICDQSLTKLSQTLTDQ